MDTIVNTALEEICSHGDSGLTLSKLWTKLQPSISSQGLKLCQNVKKVLWFNLIDIPGLKFESNGVVYNAMDSCVRSIEQSERLNLKIVAPVHMCDGFSGIYDIEASDAKLSKHERRALGCLATLRGKGIAQNELGKDFKIKGNDMFYILRKLERRGLIVRQPTILRIRDMAGEGKSPVSTNMLYLSRYAKNLGSQQRLEITKGDNSLEDNEITDCEDENSVGVAEESLEEDLHVKDFLPELEAICDKLENAEGKVLAMADIKPELGYQGTGGHRQWRYILKKLKEAQVVKEDDVIVDGKEVKCLHLLKGFSPKHFETMIKKAKRGHISDLLLELPIEHQIYDMVDAEGERGLPFIQVCKRLGLSNKQHYNRLFDIINRFGIHMEPELMNKAKGYRLWTPGNHNPGASTITLNKPLVDPSETSGCTPLGTHLEFQENSALARQDVDASVPEGNGVGNSHNVSTGIEPKASDGLVLDEKDESVPLCLSSSLDSTIKVSSTTSGAELQIVSAASSYVAPAEALPLAVPTPSRRRSYPRYPCLTLEATSAKREQWILKLLQEEKFLVRSELYRRLQDLEKEKTTMTDRKTLDRCLNKLLQGGHCKLIVAYVPVLTNCNHSRRIQVVLHPSVSSVSAEQIHERFRSFETQIRTQSSSQLKKGEPIPQLNDLARTHRSIKLNQAERAEAMRTNGFVLAKMVRTKLLHIYLWEYMNCLPGCDDVLSSFKHGHDLKNPHSTCKLIDLNAAIKAMPLELFLQVVGSTQKFEDTIEKCKNGFCLSDLPLLEYKHLMDIRATGRLSSLIDILRRLKLIRLVCGGHPENTADLPHSTLTHVLELKPYIEEPVCSVGSSHFNHCPDLRPQIRHDFVLSNKKAVEEYWNTLEYCYSASDRKAALHAFPGCAVNEVFLFRSWASVRVMTADQRVELLKRVINDGPQRKLSFKECEEIAKDLNLTFEQVLRVYHDKRQRRLTRFDRASDAGMDEIQPRQGTPTLSPKKRKRPARRKSSKHAEAGTEFGQPHETLSQIINEEESSFPSTSCTNTHSLEGYDVRDDVVAAEESEVPEDDGIGRAFLDKYALSRAKPTRRGRFCWTDDVDRQLVIEYARHRAALGAKFNRVDWGKLPNLPAPPDACRRRMSTLRTSQQFRKSVMRLCNVLSQRYVDYLKKSKDKTLNHEGHQATECCCFKHTSHFLSQDPWDNFNDANINSALDDALRCKKIGKSETLEDVQPFFDKCSDDNTDERHVSYGPQSVLRVSGGQFVENFPEKTEDSGTPLSSNRIGQKYVNLTIGSIPISKRLYESTAVANAAELFKLIFLCSSKSPLVPTLLAETLRRYSEHDLFAAFNYLRDKKVLIGGHTNNPFVLSQTFLNCIEFSPFPSDTGKRAAKFASWLCEREKELIVEGVDLPTDLQCGDLFRLCALLSSGELSIAPCLPDEGVGEVEDSRTSKRKYDDSEVSDSDRYKKLKTSMAGDGGEICSRRAKGFPGIRLCLRHATLSRVKTMDLLKDVDKYTRAPSVEEHQASDLGSVSFDSHDQVNDLPYTAVSPTESPWQAMTTYAERVCSFGSFPEQNSLLYPEMFRSVYSAIQMAGDQGLCMKDISKILKMQEEKLSEAVVEVLEAFGRVLKVNAYDSIRVVDSLYRSKYFLTPVAAIHQDATLSPNEDSEAKIDEESVTHNEEDHKDVEWHKEMSGTSDKVHKITILNLPKAIAEPSSEKQTINEAKGCRPTDVSSPTRNHPEKPYELRSTGLHLCKPILPWLNGDGTTNERVYKGLVRRVLGIVMQNPGIKEDDIINEMHVLNPQSCRSLLNMMVLDNEIFARKIPQTNPGGAPTILGSLLGSHFKKSQLISREHFFANPSSTHLL
ncbi:hypothetical protein K7X08_015601 [Anisodus acutangulus]|uniref:B-block binding subunit of TFIIIC domain-containing protein n=1 Tax=Anisodus acutangulus TaxID=402998 RepID=A0A9Q1LDN7_9SOLA|nr:hypothetical protein K7X08_015601 [Anisodus acutangulus]